MNQSQQLRIADAAEAVLIARQKVEAECHLRDTAVKQLAELLGLKEHDERTIVLGDNVLRVARRGQHYQFSFTRADMNLPF